MSIKLVVSGSSKESRITLVSRTGKELLSSATFTEPRAKGATLRALKKILVPDVIIEDSTTTIGQAAKPVAVAAAPTTAAKTAAVAAKPAFKKTAGAVRSGRQATVPAVKTPAVRKTTERTAKSTQPA